MRSFLSPLLVVICHYAPAQEKVDTTIMRRIRTEAFDHSGIAAAGPLL